MAAPADVRVVAADPDSPAGSTAGVGSQFELTFWQSIATSEDPGQFEAYLQQYPNGTFSALARAKIAALARRDSGSGVSATAVSPAPPVYEPPAPRAADDDLVRTAEAPDSASAAAVAPTPAPAPASPPADIATASTPCGATVHSPTSGEPESHPDTPTPAP